MGWVDLGCVGVLGLPLLLVACGHADKSSVANTGGADTSEAGGSGGGKANGSAGKTSSSAGSNHGGSSSSGSGEVTDLDTFLEAEGDGYCARLFRCVEGSDDFSGERLALKNEQGCKDLLVRVNANSRLLRDLRGQIAAGNIHYVPQQGQKCLADLAACNGVDSLQDGACREAFDGNAKTGEMCMRSEDCAGDAYCATPEACGGQCVPRKQEGETCERDIECAYTTGAVFCDHSTATPVCHTLRPTAKAAEGEPCTRRFEGAEALTLCQDGLWCATVPGGTPNEDTVGQCALPIPPDSPCVDDDDFCKDGVCDSTAGVCRSLTLVAKAGAACDKATWLVCDPTLGLRCNAAGTCDGSGDGSEGTACFGSDLQRGCDAGLYCAEPDQSISNDPGQCRPFVADGAACNNNEDCASGNCMDGACGGRPCLE
jgi:hypothetical protein